jgi:hypothetical protein
MFSNFSISGNLQTQQEITQPVTEETQQEITQPVTEETDENSVVLTEDNVYVLSCPWCQGTIEVQRDQLNCRIFRHAVLKDNLEPINPHTPEKICMDLIERDIVFGCGKPFRIVGDSSLHVEICDYI